MKLVIFTIVVISLATIVVKADDQLRRLQKQSSFGKGFLKAFFSSNSEGVQTDNKQDNTDQQDLENNLDQLAKALPYQMLLPRRKNSFSSPLGLLGNIMTAKNQQKTLLDDEQINPLEELNQLLSSRKRKSEKKPFHWENPDFKEDKKDLPLYKIFGKKSKKNHRLSISEEQVENILANQIPAFRDGKLLKLAQTAYSKGFFLNVQYLTKKNQVYKVKAKYNQQDNQLQIISMSQLTNFEEPEEQIQSSLDEEEQEDKFIIEEILNQQESQQKSELVEQKLAQNIQNIIQNSVQQTAQTKQLSTIGTVDNIKQKNPQKNEKNIPIKPQQAKLQTVKEAVKQQPLKQQKKNLVQSEKVQKILKKTDNQVKLQTPSNVGEKKTETKEQLKEKQTAKEVNQQQKQKQITKEIKKSDVKELPKEKEPSKQIKQEGKKKTVQDQLIKQQNKNQKVQKKQTEKKPSLPVKQGEKKVDIQSSTNLQKQGKNLAKQQSKTPTKTLSDKPADKSIIVQN